MASLRQLVEDHRRLLLLDAASTRVHVGDLSSDPGSWRWESDDGETAVGLFRCIERLEVELDAFPAFVFCEGPGSLLGIRATAMAIRTWCALQSRPVYAYQSLALAAQVLPSPAIVIADARRSSWHRYSRQDGLQRVTTEQIPPDGTPIFTPSRFRHWTPLPVGTVEVDYDPAALLAAPAAIDADLFRATDAPDAFLHEEPSYAAWKPAIHRAPTPAS
jgi:tRNA threonylcarbamoyladenosine biosynthesis protein TsaB